MSEPTNKTFTLKRITDMYEIPEDRFDDFLIQLKKWHKETKGLKEVLEAFHDITGEELPENYGTLKWIDDGINEGATKVNIVKPKNLKPKARGSDDG